MGKIHVVLHFLSLLMLKVKLMSSEHTVDMLTYSFQKIVVENVFQIVTDGTSNCKGAVISNILVNMFSTLL